MSCTLIGSNCLFKLETNCVRVLIEWSFKSKCLAYSFSDKFESLDVSKWGRTVNVPSCYMALYPNYNRSWKLWWHACNEKNKLWFSYWRTFLKNESGAYQIMNMSLRVPLIHFQPISGFLWNSPGCHAIQFRFDAMLSKSCNFNLSKMVDFKTSGVDTDQAMWAMKCVLVDQQGMGNF
jgi:hypothetical protein